MSSSDEIFFKKGADETDAVAQSTQVWIDFYHVPTGNSVFFKGLIKAFSDSFQSNWNQEQVYGRMDPIVTFQNTTRTITMEWAVVASSKDEAVDNLRKCGRLFSMLYPTYAEKSSSNALNAATINAGPLFKVRFANLVQDVSNATSIDDALRAGGGPTVEASRMLSIPPRAEKGGLLGAIDGFNYSPNFELGAYIESGEIYAKEVILSCNITVLHTHAMGWETDNNELRQGAFPYGQSSSEEAEKPSVRLREPPNSSVTNSGQQVPEEPTDLDDRTNEVRNQQLTQAVVDSPVLAIDRFVLGGGGE